MKRINVMGEEFEVVDILGQQALFVDFRVDKTTVPEGIYCYELRHDDDGGSLPITVEKGVVVNYFGAVLLTKELLKEDDYLSLTPDDFGFVGERMIIQQFQHLPQPFEDGRALSAYLMLTFNMSIKEADTLISYLDAHDYAVGHKESRGFFLYDANGEWRASSIDEVIDMVCDWNYEFIQIVKVFLDEYSGEVNEAMKHFYGILIEEEKLLDGLLSRTKYGEKVEKLAEEIAKEVVESYTQPEKLEEAVKHTAEKIKRFRREETE